MALSQKVWFITGTSTGLGRQLVYAALARNDKVVATARSLAKIQDLASPSCATLELDVRASRATISATAARAIAAFGHIDVVVNNAGHGMVGTTEEAGAEGYMDQFKTNFFGPINVTNAFLPHMRERRSGTVVFVGSRSSWRAQVPLIGPYAASKAALEATAQTLTAELAPFNIRVLSVLPGGLRTDNWNHTLVIDPASPTHTPLIPDPDAPPTPPTPAAEDPPQQQQQHEPEDRRALIAEYAPIRSKSTAWMLAQNGRQPGDPAKAAQAIVGVVSGDNAERAWPGTLVLGADAESDIRARCESVLEGLDKWRDVTRSIAIEESE